MTILSHNSLPIRLTSLIDNWSGVQQVNSRRQKRDLQLNKRTLRILHLISDIRIRRVLQSSIYLQDVHKIDTIYRDTYKLVQSNGMWNYKGTRREEMYALRGSFGISFLFQYGRIERVASLYRMRPIKNIPKTFM